MDLIRLSRLRRPAPSGLSPYGLQSGVKEEEMLRDKIADLITNELYARFGSPSSAVIGVQLADRIMGLLVKEDRDSDTLPTGPGRATGPVREQG